MYFKSTHLLICPICFLTAVLETNGDIGRFMQTLYENEARHFFILNIGPEGCAPLYLKLLNGTLDEQGCLEAINQVDQISNQLLLNELERLREKYPDIDIIHADYYQFYYYKGRQGNTTNNDQQSSVLNSLSSFVV